jgi:hypothetical protein
MYDISRLSNGGDSSSLWMMGATLNPSSTVAKEMDACLKDEIQTHSAYDPSHRSALHGVPFPSAKKNSLVSHLVLTTAPLAVTVQSTKAKAVLALVPAVTRCYFVVAPKTKEPRSAAQLLNRRQLVNF